MVREVRGIKEEVRVQRFALINKSHSLSSLILISHHYVFLIQFNYHFFKSWPIDLMLRNTLVLPSTSFSLDWTRLLLLFIPVIHNTSHPTPIKQFKHL